MSTESLQEALTVVGESDPGLVEKLSRWSQELPTEEFLRRVESVMDELEDRRDWPGHEGDVANRTLCALNESVFASEQGSH